MDETNKTPATAEPTEERLSMRLDPADIAALTRLSALTAIRTRTELVRFAIHFALTNYPRPPAPTVD